MRKVIKVTYGDKILSDLFESVTNIKRDIGSGWNNNTQAKKEGVDVISSSRGLRNISFDYIIKGTFFDEININKQKLSSYINSEIRLGLIFEDEPNKVWYALPDGEQSFSTENKSGTLTFIVPEGHAYSTYTNVLNSDNSGGVDGSITPNADGSVDITINNQGTLPTWIDLKLTNNHDNGYFGIAGVNGSLELGNREEVDGVTIKHSDVLYDSKTDPKFSKFVSAAGQPHPEWAGAGTNGTIGYQEYNYKSSNGQQKTMKGVKLINPGSQTGFRGGMAELVLPPDSNGDSGAVNFYAWFRLFTWTTSLGQTGVMQILFTDENDEFVAGYGTLKDDKTGNTGTVGFWIGGPNKGQWKHIPYVANNGEQTGLKDNNTMLNDNRGALDFFKQGSTLGFYWKGGHQRIVVPELKDVAIHKVKFFFGNWSTNPRGTMTHMVIRDFWCRKDFVNTWNDLPNRYKNGSVVEIDMSSGNVSKDGISAITEVVNGTEPFSIPPGISQIKIIQSSWNNTPPDVEISWKERIL
ncbi:distal tail protein Dit [Lactococcus lactis]|uniref:distal tail protein Dit n=1 Tax=Lactococcus lactis TaxID=1358 RepID=UPI000559AF93|nr:distal tail protein Dit [Lactococcus lactis]AJA57186.1 phage tail protein [Lactococcus lactis subsp. lactis]WBM76573.1 phage tail family protein [Lactococcus lactis]WSP31042.1 distal tail protein Dit [Lactococcus lactis subsp. lactis]